MWRTTECTYPHPHLQSRDKEESRLLTQYQVDKIMDTRARYIHWHISPTLKTNPDSHLLIREMHISSGPVCVRVNSRHRLQGVMWQRRTWRDQDLAHQLHSNSHYVCSAFIMRPVQEGAGSTDTWERKSTGRDTSCLFCRCKGSIKLRP